MKHWSEEKYWTDALEQLYRFQEEGRTQLTLDLTAIANVAFNGDGPAYKLMEAMLSVHEHEGMEGFRGAPRIMLALLLRLEELSRTNIDLTTYGFVPVGHWQLYDKVKSGIQFKLSHFQQERVIYAFVVDGSPKYIGICDNDATTLKARMGRYQSLCGGSTNKSNASRIRFCLLAGQTVQIFALKPQADSKFTDLPVDLVKGLENPLITKFKPEWNGKTLTDEAVCEEAEIGAT